MSLVADLVALGSATLGESGARPLRPGLSPVWPGARTAGPARPVRCAVGDNLEIHHAVAAAATGDVLVAVVDGEPEHGWWGEVLTVAAMARGVAGLVIDACVRDSAAIAARRFPVWSTGLALPGARKVTRGQTGHAHRRPRRVGVAWRLGRRGRGRHRRDRRRPPRRRA